MAGKRPGSASKVEKPKGAVTIMEPLRAAGGRFKPGEPPPQGAGRPPGKLNKTTTELRNMITDAVDQLGGVTYLMAIGATEPALLLGLLGKVLPSRVVGGDGDEPAIQVQEIKRTYVESPKKK